MGCKKSCSGIDRHIGAGPFRGQTISKRGSGKHPAPQHKGVGHGQQQPLQFSRRTTSLGAFVPPGTTARERAPPTPRAPEREPRPSRDSRAHVRRFHSPQPRRASHALCETPRPRLVCTGGRSGKGREPTCRTLPFPARGADLVKMHGSCSII